MNTLGKISVVREVISFLYRRVYFKEVIIIIIIIIIIS